MNDSAPSPEAVASAYGAQMAKYFTLNQPPHVAIDSAVSVVRSQLAITRLDCAERHPGANRVHSRGKSLRGFG